MQIQWDGLSEIGAEEREAIEARLRRIAARHGELSIVHIAGRESRHHRRGGREVNVAARTKGREIAASRGGAEIGRALHDAVDAFARELRRLRARRAERRLAERAGEPLPPL
ncbi:MAG TPA: hypothetical protein VEI82_11565 [Myxococcota bacterium]|nr:hypothetical protein [Myxococcota bacterium]